MVKKFSKQPPHFRLVGFLRRFGLKTGTHFAHFGLESVWFSRKLRERMNVFIVSTPNEVRRKEKYANSKWV